MATEVFTNGPLTLEVTDTGDAIEVVWRGKSGARNPGEFVLPVLADALSRSELEKRPVVIDFRALDYMNSSTVTPVIRILKQAKLGSGHVTILYQKNLKWQTMSFTALEVFHTEDKRIEIKGV